MRKLLVALATVGVMFVVMAVPAQAHGNVWWGLSTGVHVENGKVWGNVNYQGDTVHDFINNHVELYRRPGGSTDPADWNYQDGADHSCFDQKGCSANTIKFDYSCLKDYKVEYGGYEGSSLNHNIISGHEVMQNVC